MTGAAGPFLVKRVFRWEKPEREDLLSVKAVADLSAARTAAYEIVQREWRHGPPALGDQPDYEDGRQWARGLDGPGSFTLPGGDEVHVEATTEAALREIVRRYRGSCDPLMPLSLLVQRANEGEGRAMAYVVEAWRPSVHTNPEIVFRAAARSLTDAAAMVDGGIAPLDDDAPLMVVKVTIRLVENCRLARDLGVTVAFTPPDDLIAGWNRDFSFPQARGGSNG